jgi:hypothetical protein
MHIKAQTLGRSSRTAFGHRSVPPAATHFDALSAQQTFPSSFTAAAVLHDWSEYDQALRQLHPIGLHRAERSSDTTLVESDS